MTWNNSSFIFIENEFPGWNQSHYYQYIDDKYANVELEPNRVFEYVDDAKEVFVRTGVGASYPGPGSLADDQLRWELNGVLQHLWRMGGCGGMQGLTFGVIDGQTGLPWVSVHDPASNFGVYGHYHCTK